MDSPTTDSMDLAPSNARLRLVGIVAAIVLLIDQITKIWAVAALEDGPIDLFWTLRLRLIYNTGASFSMGEGFGRWLAIIVVIVVIAVLIWARRVPGVLARVLLGAIVGGAIGNLVDRVARADDGFLSGGVVDFVDFQWWPVFNVADIGVVCGAIGLMILSLREGDPAADEPEDGDYDEDGEDDDALTASS